MICECLIEFIKSITDIEWGSSMLVIIICLIWVKEEIDVKHAQKTYTNVLLSSFLLLDIFWLQCWRNWHTLNMLKLLGFLGPWPLKVLWWLTVNHEPQLCCHCGNMRNKKRYTQGSYEYVTAQMPLLTWRCCSIQISFVFYFFLNSQRLS